MHDLNIETKIVEVINTKERWIKENLLPLYGQGNYRLAPGYEQCWANNFFEISEINTLNDI